ncbi:hypothetical protein AB4874_16020 [Thioclava sp. 15-R06ZXC-3]|uniref:Type II toxin-antitoxin system PemK/MazF family toxin n=1 Tax=Thioclava arctica TaxID=3238301 RepID=A0ABV3TQ62_9RHOB
MLNALSKRTSTSPCETTRPWSETIKAGDIISFRFPLQNAPANERPKARPCLVLAVSVYDGQRWLCVAYGTTIRRKARNALGIDLSTDEAAASGLNRATGFCGTRTVVIRTNDPALCVCPALRTPVIGKLADQPRERMQLVKARLLKTLETADRH